MVKKYKISIQIVAEGWIGCYEELKQFNFKKGHCEMPQKTNKTNHYEELKQFKLKKGHCEVPQKNNKTNY